VRKHLDFYGYNSPSAGKYYIDDTEYFGGEDFRNVKRYKEYKNVGFNILLLQHENSYSGEPYQTSVLKMCLEKAMKAGIDKVIVSDTRLKDLCIEEKLFGENGKFASKKEFFDYLRSCIAPYKDEKCFYGVQLFDEPGYWQMKSFGEVFRGLKEIMPEIYLQCNLFPIIAYERLAEDYSDLNKAFREYLNSFLDETNATSITFDEYFFCRDYKIGEWSINTYQIASDVCKERNVELCAVFQTMSFYASGNYIYRRVLEQDMYWQMNLAMGFGCREFAYFTYMPKKSIQTKNSKGEKLFATIGLDGASFINRDGTRAKMYYYTRRIIKEMKDFEEVLLRYKFDNDYLFFEKGKDKESFEYTKNVLERKKPPVNVDISYGVALVTEHKNETSSLIMVENLGNIKEELFGRRPARVTIELEGDDMPDAVYYRGKKIDKEFVDGRLSMSLRCGDAIFIEIKR
jgi:hypothetical protein